IGNINIFIPNNESEQKKIVDCFSCLDDLISAVADKIETLKEYKKGLMQQLFPVEGKTIPAIRFPEFQNAGEWQTVSLGDVATFINGRAFKQDELLESGKYRVLRVGNFFSNAYWYHSDLELDENKYCDKGDLLYAWSASFGPRIWNEDKVIFHYHIWKVVEKEGISKDFFFFLFDYKTERIKNQQANGLGLLHITKGAIENWKTRVPKNILEQQKIAKNLSSVDELISIEIAKLDQLKAHKKGLMQQLFPKLQ
ncbi:restriction endonuclease subunit S, partial [uncultured Parabacteroides sp.]|uniref:restriction endonuclease subunit S n=1 Tax=uncultured Parabacteroides sp. TaxID=512312 RepID=UPI00272D6870